MLGQDLSIPIQCLLVPWHSIKPKAWQPSYLNTSSTEDTVFKIKCSWIGSYFSKNLVFEPKTKVEILGIFVLIKMFIWCGYWKTADRWDFWITSFLRWTKLNSWNSTASKMKSGRNKWCFSSRDMSKRKVWWGTDWLDAGSLKSGWIPEDLEADLNRGADPRV